MSEEQILPKTNYNSPFYSAVPLNSDPTEVLSRRFELWRQVIKSLSGYLKSACVANKQFSIINNNVVDTIQFPFFTSLYKTTKRGDVHEIKDPSPENLKKQSFFARFGSGSIQDMQILLKKYHLNMAQQQMKIVHELETKIIPRLEELQKDLFTKIREINNLNGDFKQTMGTNFAITGQLLHAYLERLQKLKEGDESELQPKTDPFLLRLRLELQLKQQLHQENYLEEAYINLQITGQELEIIIFEEVQRSLKNYSEMISQEIFVMYNDLINELHDGVIGKDTYYEWDEFIKRDNGKNLLKLTHDVDVPIPRKIADIKYPLSKDLLSKTIRSGYFLKKSKILKNYSRGFFILTVNYLHEFKSHNLFENIQPINSIRLNECILTESNERKFQLYVNNTKAYKSHNFVFKRLPEEMNEQDFKKWVLDLKSMASFDSLAERSSFVQRKTGTMGSKSQTPKFEVPNPMDMMDVNKKLQELSVMSTPQTPSQRSPNMRPISQPSTNNIMRTASNNSLLNQSLPKLQTATIVPTVQVHSPTPINMTAPSNELTERMADLEEQPSEPETAPEYDFGGGPHIIGRSSTPVIGKLQKSVMKHIDLSEPLYSPTSDTNLSKVLNSIRDHKDHR